MLYIITQISFIVLSIGCVAFIYFGLKRGTVKANLPDNIATKFIFIVLVWTILVSALSISGFLSDFSNFPPRMIIVLLVPLITLIWLANNPVTNKILTAIPEHWLFYIQGFRFFVEILLWMLFIDNLAPEQMTFEGRNFDILIGITGPIVGYYCFIKNKWSRTFAIIWNFIGIAVLLNILVIALLSMPTPFRYFMNEPANTIVAVFPIVLLPAILVPVAYYMHILSIKQLLNRS